MKPVPGLVYDSPYTFSRGQRVLLRIGPPVITATCKALLGTCRFELRNFDAIKEAQASGRHAILALWHESLLMGAFVFRGSGFHTLASYSYDGEMGARVLRRLGLFAVRGSSSRGGSDAIANMREALKHVPCVGLTLDGPRGPRQQAKPGVAILSARSQVAVFPFSVAAKPAWRLNSWDRTIIPKPFARIVAAFGEPIRPPADDSPEEVERGRLRVEGALNQLHRRLEQEMAAGSKSPPAR